MPSLYIDPLNPEKELGDPVVVTFGEGDIFVFNVLRGTTGALAIQPLDGLLSQRIPHGEGVKVELRFVSEQAVDGLVFALERLKREMFPKSLVFDLRETG